MLKYMAFLLTNLALGKWIFLALERQKLSAVENCLHIEQWRKKFLKLHWKERFLKYRLLIHAISALRVCMEIPSFFSILEKNFKKSNEMILRKVKVWGLVFLPLDLIENKNKSYCLSSCLRQGWEWGVETKPHCQA